MNILPSILTNDKGELQEKLELLKKKGYSDGVHLDIMDGTYVENETLEPRLITPWVEDLSFEAHLMVRNPDRWIEVCMSAGVERLISQIEVMEDQKYWIDEVMRLDMEVGIALDLVTSLDEVEDEVWKWVDRVLLMDVHAGFSGQEFDEVVFDKVAELQELRKKNGYAFLIELDGGLNVELLGLLDKVGVDVATVNTAFWKGLEDGSWKIEDGAVVYSK